ncbi:hypothetical protein [Verrucomicrobium spinosum]|uniref:hypothetical protein n=1 Tax=Verrucomicrobium spinosum TaxID=2736 RepID=UPI00017455AD|nr:hypothetical protein [Verrucomicrobium spinosum]
MNPHVTKLPSNTALVINEALHEIGDTEGAALFLDALEVTDKRLRFIPPCFLPITVTPQVTQAVLSVVTAGQLDAYVNSGVDSQTLLLLVTEWQAELSGQVSSLPNH